MTEAPGTPHAPHVPQVPDAPDAPDEPGTVAVAIEPTHVLVRLAGEIDALVKADLDAAVRTVTAERSSVVVDVGAVTFMDSTGLSFLARLVSATDLVPGAARVNVVAPDPQLAYVLELTDLVSILDVTAS